MAKKAKGARGQAWGILNPWGDMWSFQTFDTADDARAYVHDFWRGDNGSGGDLSRFKPVRVNVHVTLAAKQDDPS